MKSCAVTLIAIPLLTLGGEVNHWREIFEDEVEGIRKFEVVFDAPKRVKISLSRKGHTQILRIPSLEKGFTLTVIAPEIYGVDAHLTAKLRGHSTYELHTMATVNDPTNLHTCEPDLSQNFEIEVGRYTLSVSEDSDPIVRPKLNQTIRDEN